jgi:hypothetical protein
MAERTADPRLFESIVRELSDAYIGQHLSYRTKDGNRVTGSQAKDLVILCASEDAKFQKEGRCGLQIQGKVCIYQKATDGRRICRYDKNP